MVAGSIETGPGTSAAWATKMSGTVVRGLAGKTNMLSGMSAWNSVDSMKSTNWRASPGAFVPRNTPAYSTWRKQPSVTTPVDGLLTGGSAKTNSATGLAAYDTTIGRSPAPAP